MYIDRKDTGHISTSMTHIYIDARHSSFIYVEERHMTPISIDDTHLHRCKTLVTYLHRGKTHDTYLHPYVSFLDVDKWRVSCIDVDVCHRCRYVSCVSIHPYVHRLRASLWCILFLSVFVATGKTQDPYQNWYAIHPSAHLLRHRTHIYINMTHTWPISTSIWHTSMCWSTATQNPDLHRRLTYTYIDMTYIHTPID